MLKFQRGSRRVTTMLLALYMSIILHIEAQAATTVAVIDSGVDADHVELDGKVINGFDLTSGNDAGADRVGHGTAMASLIAGHELGACPDCQLVSLKVTDEMSVSVDRLAAAIDIAVDENVSVIYVGAGAVETNQALENAVARAHATGTQIVAPAGTSGREHALYPAAYETVIGVAPLGHDVLVARAGGGRMTVGGSSPAAAIVAGAQASNSIDRLYSDQLTTSGTVRSDAPSPVAMLQYGDTDDTDIIFDAPWRTIRDYVPFLVFTAEFKQHDHGPTAFEKRTIDRIELFNYDPASGTEQDLIFLDVPDGSDKTSCRGRNIEIIDPYGRVRGTIDADEHVDDFWHYIARIPVGCIGIGAQRGQAGEHHLLARVHWTTTRKSSMSIATESSFDIHRVLRVLVGHEGLPRFAPEDHYYDAHVHTIAEQTAWHGVTNVDASKKAFGGPLAMLTESAYALGLLEIQLNNGNWTAYRDQLVTTDHNAFFSGNPYDAGTAPGHGPTSHVHTNGKEGEFLWYREHFGELSGEELTLWGAGRDLKNPDGFKKRGSHFLVYGAPHFEGPWHGGHFTVGTFRGTGNPNGIGTVLERLRHTDAFGYAAHPFSGSDGWSEEYFNHTVGVPPKYNDGSADSRILQNNSREFIFKGMQVWNEKHEYKASRLLEGENLEVSDLSHMDPFTQRSGPQRFKANPRWDKALNGSMLEYLDYVKIGLKYNFFQRPDHRFIRKLYMSAGTDAHGDFNYLSSLESTAVAEIHDAVGASVETANITSNAFGRVRTYTLTGEKLRPEPQPRSAVNKTSLRRRIESRMSVAVAQDQRAVDDTKPGAGSRNIAPGLRASVKAYREGNTILTDGPICKFNVDSECRFDSNSGNPRWHDNSCAWENPDGIIGGRGDFDGGGSVLVPRGSTTVVNAIWDGRNDYLPVTSGQPESSKMVLAAHTNGPSGVMKLNAVPRRQPQHIQLDDNVAGIIGDRLDYSPSVLMVRADIGSEEHRASCITNPVWTIPVSFEYPKSPSVCSIKPGYLRVSVRFGVSMDTTSGGQGASIRVYPLDGSGQSVGEGVSLSAKWSDNILPDPRMGKIADANLVAENQVPIACPGADWDAESHSRVPHARSFAVVVSNLRDMHGNELNAIADTITVTTTRGIDVPMHPAGNTGTVFDPGKAGPDQSLSCSSSGKKICGSYGATCEVTTARNGSRQDLCRWSSANTSSSCKRTVGLWTTPQSKYAKNHPGVVAAGTAGACITEVKNLKNRIQ